MALATRSTGNVYRWYPCESASRWLVLTTATLTSERDALATAGLTSKRDRRRFELLGNALDVLHSM